MAKRERYFQIINEINTKYQADLIRKAIDPSGGQLTNEQINQTDFNRTDNNEPLAPPLPSGSLDILDKFVNKLSDEVNADIPDRQPTPLIPIQIKPEVVSTPTLQDILTVVVEVKDDSLRDLQSVRDEVIRLDFPQQTGIRSVDEQNLDDYYDTLQQIRPDLFFDEDGDVPDLNSMPDLEDIPDFPEIPDLNLLRDTPSNVPYLLVPTDVNIGSNDPADILADPNVTTIILPTIGDQNNSLLLLNFLTNFLNDLFKKKKLDTEIAVSDVVPKKERKIPANVDISTIERLPWVDFKTILDNTDLNKRTQVILDILQSNMPASGDDIYYIYHDQRTNIFSIEVDENSDEVQDFIESILVIDARLKIGDLSEKDRTYLKKLRKSKLQVLRKQYKAHALAEVLDNKLTEEEKLLAEKKIIEIQQKLNRDSDEFYYVFNAETDEYELRKDHSGSQIIHKTVAAILKLDEKYKNTQTKSERKKITKIKNAFIEYLSLK